MQVAGVFLRDNGHADQVPDATFALAVALEGAPRARLASHAAPPKELVIWSSGDLVID